ncbi:MAG: hypothetical protein HWN67_10290 [Candidatus Helarchaeota archaeon]|nr:hypothetical protein [Candidatus Helarchaeota archaeon]
MKAYNAILYLGICEAKDICYKTHIPTSKIYNILEKLEKTGLIEIQQSRPKKYRVLNPTLTYDKLYALKSNEFKEFKENLLQFKSYLEKKTPKDNSVFWNVALDERDIFKKHVSRFYFVEKLAYMRINATILKLLTDTRNTARTIYDTFKTKGITYKLIIGYQTAEKNNVLEWINSRPEKPNPQNIRMLEEKSEVNDQIFGIFDRDKIILFYKDPVNPQKFLTSLFMTNKPLYNDLYTLFTKLWDEAEAIN